MRTYPGKIDGQGRLVSFEIDNVYISISKLKKVLAAVPDVEDVRKPTSDAYEGERIRFTYRGHDCMVLEPFGDNSRYWFCLRNSEWSELDFKKLQNALENYQPSIIVKMIGNILTLNFS